MRKKTDDGGRILVIAVGEIARDENQPRKSFDEAGLESLASSLREHGQLQPVVVREKPGGGYILIAGERRWRAAKLGKIATLRAVLEDVAADDLLELAMVENLQREDMSLIDEARGYQNLMTQRGYDLAELSDRFGRGVTTIENYLGWLELDDEIQELVAAERIPRHSDVRRALLSITDADARVKLAQVAANRNMTAKGIVQACKVLQARLRPVPDMSQVQTPAFRIAGITEREPAKWDALRQVGVVPVWSEFTAGVQKTCETCALRDMASENVCGACPLVALLKTMTEDAV